MALTLKAAITATQTTVEILGTDAIHDGDIFSIDDEYLLVRGDPGVPGRPLGITYYRIANFARGVEGTAEVAHAAGATLTQVLPGAGGSVDAAAVTFTPAGTIAATNVQAAIEEVASEAGGASVILKSTPVVLNHAAILALPTTSQIVVPAPGAGFALLLVGALLVSDCTAGAYTNITAGTDLFGSGLSLTYGNDDQSASLLVSGIPLLSSNAGKLIATLSPYVHVDASTPTVHAQNAGGVLEDAEFRLVAYNTDGDYDDGHADNTLTVTVYYAVVPV